MIDAAVRARPEAAYDYAELFGAAAERPAAGAPAAGTADSWRAGRRARAGWDTFANGAPEAPQRLGASQ